MKCENISPFPFARASSIGDVVLPVRSWNPSREARDATFLYIDLGSIDNARKCITSIQSVSASRAPSRARQLVAAGDLLLSTVRPNLNGLAQVPSDLDGATASTGFCVLRPDPQKCDGRYLFHWLQQPEFVSEMVRRSTGANYPAVTNKAILSSLMPLPEIAEQRRIAATLDKADAIRCKCAQAVALTSELIKSTFLEMFGDPTRNPKRLRTARLGDLITVSSGVGLVARDMDASGAFPVYGGNGINGFHSEFMFEEPKIVIGRVGVYCGAVHVTQPKSWVTDNALYVKELKAPIERAFLEWALRLANLNQFANQAAQPLISGGRIYPVEIVYPEREAQIEFVTRIEKARLLALRCRQSLEAAEAIFASTSQRAFRGEL